MSSTLSSSTLFREEINREFDEDFKVYWRSDTKCTIEKKHPDVSLGSGWGWGRSDPMGGLGWGRSDTWGMGGRSYQPPTDQFMATYMIEVIEAVAVMVNNSSRNAKVKISIVKGQTTNKSYHQERLNKLNKQVMARARQIEALLAVVNATTLNVPVVTAVAIK